jgi:hypothetical protein
MVRTLVFLVTDLKARFTILGSVASKVTAINKCWIERNVEASSRGLFLSFLKGLAEAE